MSSILLTLLVSLSSGAQSAPDVPEHRILTLDPVILVEGVECEGKPEYAVDRYGFRYLFASPVTRSAFDADPRRYEFQMGGACARMGPLSGRGRATIWTVWDGHLYAFASEQCREGFLESPEQLVERIDPVAAGDATEAAAGRALIERAAKAHGGAALDQARTYEEFVRSTSGSDPEIETTKTYTLRFPGDVHTRSTYGPDYVYEMLVTDACAVSLMNGTIDEPLHPVQAEALRRGSLRRPIALLRSRTAKNFVAIAREGSPEGGVAVPGAIEYVDVSFAGTTTTLGIDRVGKVRSATWNGRGPSLAFGTVSERYSDWIETSGVLVPQRIDTLFDGAAWPERSQKFAKLEVNGELPGDWFDTPGD